MCIQNELSRIDDTIDEKNPLPPNLLSGATINLYSPSFLRRESRSRSKDSDNDQRTVKQSYFQLKISNRQGFILSILHLSARHRHRIRTSTRITNNLFIISQGSSHPRLIMAYFILHLHSTAFKKHRVPSIIPFHS
jgi:hypothetical protein